MKVMEFNCAKTATVAVITYRSMTGTDNGYVHKSGPVLHNIMMSCWKVPPVLVLKPPWSFHLCRMSGRVRSGADRGSLETVCQAVVTFESGAVPLSTLMTVAYARVKYCSSFTDPQHP